MLPSVKTFLGLPWAGLAVFGQTVVGALFSDAAMKCDQMSIEIDLMVAACHSIQPLARNCEVTICHCSDQDESKRIQLSDFEGLKLVTMNRKLFTVTLLYSSGGASLVAHVVSLGLPGACRDFELNIAPFRWENHGNPWHFNIHVLRIYYICIRSYIYIYIYIYRILQNVYIYIYIIC